MNEDIDAGSIFRDTVYAWAERHPDWSAEVRLWHDRWLDLASPRIEGSIRLQRALRAKGVTVFALTNFGDSTWEAALPQMDFLRDFDRAYVSGKMGVTKPDPQIYAMVEADCGLPPESLLFTDDKAENIVAAARRGWRTHQFESWQGWAARLVAEGLLTAEEAGL
jgi:2-haloacid dehalogenase